MGSHAQDPSTQKSASAGAQAQDAQLALNAKKNQDFADNTRNSLFGKYDATSGRYSGGTESASTIVYTTHLMHEAEELCDRVAIIDHGQIIALGSPNELKASLVLEDVVHLEGVLPASVVDRLRAIPGIQDVTAQAEANGRTSLAVRCDNSRALLPRMIEAVTSDGASLEFIKPQEVTLEDVFVARTGRTLAVDTSEVVKEAKGGGRGRG